MATANGLSASIAPVSFKPKAIWECVCVSCVCMHAQVILVEKPAQPCRRLQPRLLFACRKSEIHIAMPPKEFGSRTRQQPKGSVYSICSLAHPLNHPPAHLFSCSPANYIVLHAEIAAKLIPRPKPIKCPIKIQMSQRIQQTNARTTVRKARNIYQMVLRWILHGKQNMNGTRSCLWEPIKKKKMNQFRWIETNVKYSWRALRGGNQET